MEISELVAVGKGGRMTFTERNEILQQINKSYSDIHDKYTSKVSILTDEEWKSYIAEMDAVANEYKSKDMFKDFSGKLCMAYLDDTEYVQKRLREVKKE